MPPVPVRNVRRDRGRDREPGLLPGTSRHADPTHEQLLEEAADRQFQTLAQRNGALPEVTPGQDRSD